MILILSVLLLLATFSTKIAAPLGIPGLIVFLALGMIFGSDGFNLVQFDDPVMAQQIAVALLIVILFEGGFSTERKLLKVAFRPAFTLATVGVIITAVTLGVMSHLFLGLEPLPSLLLGVIVASTDAAAVFSIFRNRNIEPRIAATLEIESASNDPTSIILTIAIIDIILGKVTNPLLFAVNLGWQIAAGIAVGFLIGKAGPYYFNKVRLDTGGFYYVLILGLCFLGYGLAEELRANGFLAVFIAGFWMGNSEFIYKQGITRFIEGVSAFSHVMLFLMLGLLVFPSEVLTFWKQGVIIALLIIFIARPVAVFISTAFWKYTLKEKLFLCWGGIRGAVPIVLATYPFVAGIDRGNYFFNIVFFVVLISALIQGSTIDIAAKKLGLYVGERVTQPHSLELISLEETKCELLEYNVKKDSCLINKQLQEIPLPKSSLVNAIVRQDKIITPRGDTTIKGKDLLFILVKYEDKDELLSTLEGCPQSDQAHG